jgi:G3E family GTPase
MKTPVHLVAGFLGSGKTTALLDQLARRPDERVAVIVNDFGESAYDAELLGAAAPTVIREIPGGCICCTAPEGFIPALREILETAPDRVFIEPTGLAMPADLIDTLHRSKLADQIDFRPLVVLVDPDAWAGARSDAKRPARFQFMCRQIEAAQVLLASRTELAQPAHLVAFETWAQTLWPAPMSVGRTHLGALPEEALDWGGLTETQRAPAIEAGTGLAGFHVQSWRWSAQTVFSLAEVRQAIESLAALDCNAKLERFKAVLRTDEGTHRVEWAGGQWTARLTGYRSASVADCIISGENLQLLERCKAALQRAICPTETRSTSLDAIEFVLPDGRRVLFDRDKLSGLPGGIPDVSTVLPGRSGAAAALQSIISALDLPLGLETVVVASDGYASPAVAVSDLSRAVLLHSLADQALPEAMGGPFRLLIPGDAGPAGACSNVKSVVRFVLRTPAADSQKTE